MIKKIAIVIAVLIAILIAPIAGFLMFVASKPDTFSVQRSAVIKAPPEKIFALINDFKRWDAWSPWEKLDPAMKKTWGVVTSGKGAYYAWDGNSDAGQGSMEITESTPPTRIKLKLDFVRPVEGHNVVDFTLEGKDDATKVTWAMHGPAPFVLKVMQIFTDMDGLIGKDFEAGFANLKALAEK